MSNKTITIAFKNIHQLWKFAKKIDAKFLQIIAKDMILICDCSEGDIELLVEYGGEVVQEYTPMEHGNSLN
jgi:hypothetical protein